MEAGFGLEPLSGESGVDGGAGCGADAAEGEVACGPDLGAARVGPEDGPPDVVGADEGGYSAFDHGEGGAVKPHIFADQGARGLVILGDSIPGAVEHRMNRDAARQHPDRLPPGEVVFVAGFQNPADGEFGHPSGGVVGIAVAARRAVIIGDVASRVIGKRPAAARTKADGAEFVRGGGVGINIRLHPCAGVDGVADPVADATIIIEEPMQPGHSLRRAGALGPKTW